MKLRYIKKSMVLRATLLLHNFRLKRIQSQSKGFTVNSVLNTISIFENSKVTEQFNRKGKARIKFKRKRKFFVGFL